MARAVLVGRSGSPGVGVGVLLPVAPPATHDGLNGTGRRAALAVPTFGKTGTSQGNRDALFVGFAGNLVVGVWVGRDDDKPLGSRISGSTAPAQIWRNFMVPALAVDGKAGPPLPAGFRLPEKRQPTKKSRLPEEWSEGSEPLRQIIRKLEQLFDEN